MKRAHVFRRCPGCRKGIVRPKGRASWRFLQCDYCGECFDLTGKRDPGQGEEVKVP